VSGAPQPTRTLALPFSWTGREGEVRVEISENDDPAGLGCADFAHGFPVCRAMVAPPSRGYADMLGWVQLVDDSYHGGGFHADGFEPLGPLPHPFGFYGVSPTLFDAPHYDGENFDFLAHTFLCGLGGELLEYRREVRAVLGFSWGCTKRGPEIEFLGPAALPPGSWDAHREYLSRTFPGWTIAAGYLQHPLQP
jgi:hypothetical protein